LLNYLDYKTTVKFILFLFATILVFCSTANKSTGQNTFMDSASVSVSDTLLIKPERYHSPTKATLFSTFVPGLGQAYNKKYWKVPIVYAAIGIPLYFAVSNNQEFKRFKTAYGLRIDGDALTVDEFDGTLSEAAIKSNLDYHQRNKDLAGIFVGLFYVFNIVDAAVDAHLFNFPKNDNLSFNLQPDIQMTNNNELSKGFRLVINL
jgi:hypothetical protein